MIRLPGLIEIRCGIESGDNWRDAGTAALAGGFSTILGMMNPSQPVNTPERVDAVLSAAAVFCPCDYAVLYQADGSNARETDPVKDQVAGLSLDFRTQTGGSAPDMHLTTSVMRGWHSERPICVQGSAEQIGAAIFTANMQRKPIHVSNITTRAQLEIILESRQNGMRVTCDAALHTLFFSRDHPADFPAPRRALIPPLGSEEDRKFLWQNIRSIDCFSSGHSPQAYPEDGQAGYPALETAVPLLVRLLADNFLTLDEIALRFHQNPLQIFGLLPQPETYCEIDETAVEPVNPAAFHTKNRYSPFRGMTFPGRVQRTVVRGVTVYQRGEELNPAVRGEPALAGESSGSNDK